MTRTTKEYAPSPEELGAKVAKDPADALRRDREKVTTKIEEARAKLVSKLRAKAEKAKAALEAKKDGPKRDVLRQRFELYADAADDLEERPAHRQSSPASDRGA